MTTRRTFFRSLGLVAAVPTVAVAKAVGAIPKPEFEPIRRTERITPETFNKRFRAIHDRIDNL